MVKKACQEQAVGEIERRSKKSNVVVSNVPGAPVNIKGNEWKAIDIDYLCSSNVGMVRDEIRECFRAGRVRKDNDGNTIPRPCVMIFKKEETAHLWHNGLPCRVNEDLCRIDRHARFLVWQQRRKQEEEWKQQAGSVGGSQTTVSSLRARGSRRGGKCYGRFCGGWEQGIYWITFREDFWCLVLDVSWDDKLLIVK